MSRLSAGRIAARKPYPEISVRLVPANPVSSWSMLSRADGSLLCVRRTNHGLHLTERASAASICLTQGEPKTTLYCSSGRSSLRAATPNDVADLGSDCPHFGGGAACPHLITLLSIQAPLQFEKQLDCLPLG